MDEPVMVFGKQFFRPLLKLQIFGQLALALGLSGCMSANTFTAKSLPPELCSAVPQSAHAIDLSSISSAPTNNNLIAGGDVLTIKLAAGLSDEEIVEFDVRVGNDGAALLPEVGIIQLGGFDIPGAEKAIAAACVERGLYRNPNVGVALKRREMNRVTVVGAVKEPGIKELPRGSSHLLAAILAAGGLQDKAGTNVEIRRPGGGAVSRASGTSNALSGVHQAGHTESAGLEAVEPIHLNLAEASKESAENTLLQDGCIVTVERLSPDPIEVIGLVRKPGQFEYPVTHELRLLGSLALAGGVSSKHTKKVLVIRRHPCGSGFVVVKANINKAKYCPEENLRLAPGDIVSVEETLGTAIADAVNFVRFGVGATVPLF
jgi:polysaccharide export outer membrane protein